MPSFRQACDKGQLLPVAEERVEAIGIRSGLGLVAHGDLVLQEPAVGIMMLASGRNFARVLVKESTE
jgi:hypothetical protein